MPEFKQPDGDRRLDGAVVVRMNFFGDATGEASKVLQVGVLYDGDIVSGLVRAGAPPAHWKAVIAMAMFSYETGSPITLILRPVSGAEPDIVYIQLANVR